MSNIETQKKTATSPYFDNAEVLSLPIENIAVGQRIGFYWSDKGLALGHIILADGQNTPIIVAKSGPNASKPYRLIAGLHRLNGMREVGLKNILAIEAVNRDADEIKLIEASENMHRRDFGPIERSMFIRSIADVYESKFKDSNEGLSQQQIAAKSRWKIHKNNIIVKNGAIADAHSDYAADMMSAAYGWQDHVAEEVGMTSRTLRRYLLIYREIISITEPEMLKKLASHSLGQQLTSVLKICKIANQDARVKLIKYIANNPQVSSVEEAMIAIEIAKSSAKAPANGQTKYMNNALSNFQRLSASNQMDYAAEIAEKLKRDAVLHLRNVCNARLAALDVDGGDNG